MLKFLFFRKSKNIYNKVELARFIIHKSESIYTLSNYFHFENHKKTYAINTTIKDVPVIIENGKLVAKVKYVTIPDTVVYFILHITNIETGYMSSTNTIDVIINAKIKGEECKDFNFKLSPVFERRTLSSCI